MKPLRLMIIALLGIMPLTLAQAANGPDHDDITMQVI